MLLVRLEEYAKDLGEGYLELVLVLVLFLEHHQVLLVHLVLLVAVLVLLLQLLVVLLSVLGLLQEIEDLLAEHFDTCLLEQALARFFQDFLDRLSLGNEAFRLRFCVHGVKHVVGIHLGHLMHSRDVPWLCLLGTLDETG